MTATRDQKPPLYLDGKDAVDRFIASIAGTRAIALDTEGASFHRFIDRIYLLQLSTREASAILDPLTIGVPEGLGALLESRDVEVVFHDADYDLRLLHQDYGWRITNIFDTRVAAQLLGIRAFGLAALLEKFFGIKLDKKHQRADWSMRPLTAGMLDYAAQDTEFLLDLRDRLGNELQKLERATWAAEEFARLEGTRWDSQNDREAFLRVKGARDLTRRQLAILRELVVWRDGVAESVDRATFRVVSNETLLDIARAAPNAKAQLAGVKGMPRGILEARAGEMLDGVARGLAVPDAELPRFPRSQRWERDPDFDDVVARLKTVRDAAAARLDLDAGVLCGRERLEAVARKRPATVEELTDIPDLRRWQIEQLGADFVRALRNAPSSSGAGPRVGPANKSESNGKNGDDSPYKQ
ncbi:MAG TPA: HRDC domain-containing protein [Gemmatimonadaceae bacterium]|nr:HRDC domain-containing protein [Gemmatimonadaceae bacterium]